MAKTTKRKKERAEAGDLFSKLRPATVLNKRERTRWNKWHLQFWLALDKLRDKATFEKAPTVAEAQTLLDMLSDVPYLEVE
jgi:hypothetical protein